MDEGLHKYCKQVAEMRRGWKGAAPRGIASQHWLPNRLYNVRLMKAENRYASNPNQKRTAASFNIAPSLHI
jgi:hypothetical protein